MSDAHMTTEIRAALFYYAARNYRPLIVVDECQMHDSQTDVYFLNDKGMGVDVEIKVSLGDLRAECEKSKHRHWGRVDLQRLGLVANYFVFCIPKSIAEKAVPFIAEHWPFAGVLVKHPGRHDLVIIRKMRRVHAFSVPNGRRQHLAMWQARRYTWLMYRRLTHIRWNQAHGRDSEMNP